MQTITAHDIREHISGVVNAAATRSVAIREALNQHVTDLKKQRDEVLRAASATAYAETLWNGAEVDTAEIAERARTYRHEAEALKEQMEYTAQVVRSLMDMKMITDEPRSRSEVHDYLRECLDTIREQVLVLGAKHPEGINTTEALEGTKTTIDAARAQMNLMAAYSKVRRLQAGWVSKQDRSLAPTVPSSGHWRDAIEWEDGWLKARRDRAARITDSVHFSPERWQFLAGAPKPSGSNNINPNGFPSGLTSEQRWPWLLKAFTDHQAWIPTVEELKAAHAENTSHMKTDHQDRGFRAGGSVQRLTR